MTPELDAVLSQSPVWRRLYETNPRYRKLWDSGKGPGQQPNQLSYGPQYNHWGPLHYYAVKHRSNWNRVNAYMWYWGTWVPNLPRGCGCKKKWIDLNLQPDFSSPQAFFEWAHYAHELVNAELGKTFRPSLQQAYQIWGFQ